MKDKFEALDPAFFLQAFVYLRLKKVREVPQKYLLLHILRSRFLFQWGQYLELFALLW